MSFIEEYKKHTEERAKLGIPPLPLTAKQTAELVELLKMVPIPEEEYLMDLFLNHINPGVDEAAYVKAAFLNDIIQGKTSSPAISPKRAVEILGTMLGGYNVKPLIDALSHKDEEIAQEAANQLKNILLVYDAFHDVEELAKAGNKYAKDVLESWANAQWFTSKNPLPESIKAIVFKVPGETNTDDLSPASEAFTRSDIPLHATSMLKAKIPDALNKIAELKEKGLPVAFVGDVVGTGSSRKSAANSLIWHIGEEIPFVPNKKRGGIVIGSVIAPIFFNTLEDSGALPIEGADVSKLETGDEIEIRPYEGKILKNGEVISEFKLKPNTLPDEVRAGGRVPLIIGKNLTKKARVSIGMEPEADIFIRPAQPKGKEGVGYTLAQKIIGKACGMEGVRPGMYVEPTATTVGSQDTTGAMTRDEIKELAALGFNADLVLQTFCHTAAYPKPADVKLHHTLPAFITSRGGVALRPGDGVIHSWLNRMILPDTLGTGGDSHTRFPMGISFPAGSGLVAFAAVTGSMPLNVPESVLVKFKGELQPGITLRDLVNAIPYFAIKQGLLTVEKKNKKNVFNGRILEIEGDIIRNLTIEQAFELADASAERSAAACTVDVSENQVEEYLKSNIKMLEAMIEAGYEDKRTLQRRIDKMKEWLKNPKLLRRDENAEYAAVIEIDLDKITEPIVACPNDPDDVATISEVLADENRPHKIDEVFIGSCMTNIGHYRAAAEILKGEGQVPTRLWIAPPTKMDKEKLTEEGYYAVFGQAGARIEIPGCSLCMGNQARVRDFANVFSTSTRNFDNRMGKGAKVYLGSAELAAVTALLGRIPTPEEYKEIYERKLAGIEDKVYNYLYFHKMPQEDVKHMLNLTIL
ncbi:MULTISPECIES: bifunctional aconitate hydratase 2/2-methylisocitrate dehydratase [unclassified Lebetimonas]|uniref:bifunctional aconitate hydratase 2/2-methylisocitrate dehydratase n=1 Tax=unclassified Lebetimonas TaxID=2648158 RepID=UPI000466A034|nr:MULTISPECIES: bifunctional aconitate hydratase 2/2-methylisocitrate dehydratase [unclassified Lebetimonas]